MASFPRRTRWARIGAWTAVSALVSLGCAGPGEQVAEPAAQVATRARASHESTEVLEMASSFSEQSYRIDVALPYSYQDSDAQYPVLYLLDSDVLFGLVTDVTRLLPIEVAFLGESRVPELIVVGIGYPGGIDEGAERRGWDFNPPEEVNPDGAANFFRFVSEQLIPRIEAEYRAVAGDRTLLGSSRAGLFVLSSLFQHPEAFQRLIALSPILDPAIFDYEARHAESAADLSVRLFLSAGDLGQPETGIAEGLAHLEETLEGRGHAGLRLTTRSYPGESHLSVLPGALVDGLLAVFADG